MEKKRQRQIIIAVVIIALIAVGGLAGYKIYQKNVTEKEIAKHDKNIGTIYDSFNDAKNRDDKIALLSKMIDEGEKYQKQDNSLKEITSMYANRINKMKEDFATGIEEAHQ